MYLDFSKAFDLVCHSLLLDKLQLLGFDSFVVRWVKSFLIDRNMSVSVDGDFSSSRRVTSGIPQGSVLGQVLFLIYIKFVAKEVRSFWVTFADDFKLGVIYPNGTSGHDRHRSVSLQQDLDSVSRIGRSWNLRLNADKWVAMRFGKRNVD